MYSTRLLNAVKEHKGFERFSELMKKKFPELSLKCMYYSRNYSVKNNTINSSLVVYASDARNVLKPNINVLKTYEAANADELADVFEKDEVDSEGFLKRIFAHYRPE